MNECWKWSAEEEATLAEMLYDNKTFDVVARVLGRTAGAVKAHTYKIGLSKNKIQAAREKPRKPQVASERYDCMPDPLWWYYGRPKRKD